MLGPPVAAVLGCADLDAATRFFAAFGFVASDAADVPDESARLAYGLDGPTAEVQLATPGTGAGAIRLVRTPHREQRRGPLDLGGYAVDVYTRDIERSRADLERAGWRCSPIARWQLQGSGFAEMRVEGPPGLRVVLVEGPRRASVLDVDPDRLHSEAQAYVYVLAPDGGAGGDGSDGADARPDGDAAFWTGPAGLQLLRDDVLPLAGPLAAMLDSPPEATHLRLGLYWHAPDAGRATRVETLRYPGTSVPVTPPGSPEPSAPLRAGLGPLVFRVPDVAAAAAALAPHAQPPVAVDLAGRRTTLARGASPAGVPFQLEPGPASGARP